MSLRAGPPDDTAERAAEAVRALGATPPEVAIVLGSGLGSSVDGIEAEATLSYEELPGFPAPTVPGHAGRLVLGRLSGVPVLAFQGRVHFYEGHPMSVVTLPTRVAAALGARTLVSTAAVGSLDPGVGTGALVVATDHLSFLGESPLRGWRDAEGMPPFVDLSTAYDRSLVDLAVECAEAAGLPASRGVYVAMPGPAYETPAELEFLRRSGATVVGMSVVPEAVAAAALGMRFGALCCVTNVVGEPVEHRAVTTAAGLFAERLGAVLAAMIPKI